jgi:hypothetical protein
MAGAAAPQLVQVSQVSQQASLWWNFLKHFFRKCSFSQQSQAGWQQGAGAAQQVGLQQVGAGAQQGVSQQQSSLWCFLKNFFKQHSFSQQSQHEAAVMLAVPQQGVSQQQSSLWCFLKSFFRQLSFSQQASQGLLQQLPQPPPQQALAAGAAGGAAGAGAASAPAIQAAVINTNIDCMVNPPSWEAGR